jgi:hypothetical protein
MSYNGHKSHAAWNVSLWINNDEPLYRLAKDCVRRSSNRQEAAEMILSSLPEKTPDGVKYTVTNIRLALRGI